MRTFKLLTVLFLFLLVPASITRAQTITSHKGLTTATFNTAEGNVTVYLPDKIYPGEQVSGTVVTEPSGKNAKQLEKNLATLMNYVVRIEDKKINLQTRSLVFDWMISKEKRPGYNVELLNESGKRLQQLSHPFEQQATELPAADCFIPSHGLTGDPFRITGIFDGKTATTQCMVGGQPAQVLAESPRQSIILFPKEAKGFQTMTVREDNEDKCERTVSGVDMQINTGNLNLKKGQSTFIDIKITGLENLPDKAVLTIANLSPAIVSMTSGNLQVIPIMPIPDSLHGVYVQHCPAVSIATGNFTVSINLDLPDVVANANPTSEVPPGYIKKSCECSVTATVTKSGNTYKAEAKPACKGQYGIGINTFPGCSVLGTAYEWSILSGKENVDLTGKLNTASVNVRPKKNGAFVVCVKVTVTCVDGTVCVTTTCADQSGQLVTPPGPGTDTRPPDTNPPVTGDPTRPPVTTERVKCECECTLAGAMIPSPLTKDGQLHFTTNVTGGCKNKPCPQSGIPAKCGTVTITYKWKVSVGAGVIAIAGRDDGPGVAVNILGTGNYVLQVNGVIKCEDGSECPYVGNYEGNIPPVERQKSCMPILSDMGDPKMDGGLKANQIGIGTGSSMYRDEFITLEAEGADIDRVKIVCDPSKPDCPDTKSEKIVALNGKVRFEWAITSGEGVFVKLGCASENEMTDLGEHVIFRPPYVPLPVKNTDTTFITVIQLQVIDDGSPVLDETQTKNITIKTKRKKSNPDKYEIEITSEKYRLPVVATVPEVKGTCSIKGPGWEQLDDLVKPVIQLPAVAQNDTMVLGQWIVLKSQDQQDMDVMKVECVSAGQCPTQPVQRNYADNIIWNWTIVSGGGKFLLSSNGQYVVYEAPLEMAANKNVIEVKIKVTIKNPPGQRTDKTKESDVFTLKIYRPGVKLSHPPLNWLPEDSNHIELKSELMYRLGNNWVPAVSHMCRIHFFELLNVSEEKGICMNDPILKDADECRDLQLKKETGHEVFNDEKGKGKCSEKELYQEARTERPVREHRIIVYSRDFGAYGFFRSFANAHKKGKTEGKPLYVSIPVKKADVQHPDRRQKKTEYTDNRVTIPHDIDENHIADNGWTTLGNVRMRDPVANNVDEDDTPAGDGFKGDGLTTYEEYRGFKTLAAAGGVQHVRSNYMVKNIFIRNEDNLSITLYDNISELDVYEISESQYNGDDKRVVNFNSTKATHVVDQMGLHLVDLGDHSSLLGIAFSPLGQPTIPNMENQIRIYTGKIQSVAEKRNINYTDKLSAVVAHELLHGNNVCHHGEGDPGSENSFDKIRGLRSGNVSCVMRYDNVGTIIQGFNPEEIGSALCNSPSGTGYNASNQRFRDAADKRGNCKGQIRVSGVGKVPKSCGNR